MTTTDRHCEQVHGTRCPLPSKGPTAHIRQNDRGYWDVLIGDLVVLSDESYPVACSIESALNGYDSL